MNKEPKTMSENEESMESRLEQILNDALIKATDTYSVPLKSSGWIILR